MNRKILHITTNKNINTGAALVCFIILITAAGALVNKKDPIAMNVADRLMAPNPHYILGTDEFGRDLFSRIISGTKVSLTVGFLVSLSSTIAGLLIGVYAGFNKILEQVLMRICDGLIAIPGILLAIALMAAFGGSIWNVIIALTIVSTPNIARLVRSSTLSIKNAQFVKAARALGAGNTRLIWYHIVPNILSPLLVQSTFVFSEAILSEASLSFLGAGIPAPDASLGNILYAGKVVIYKAWWMIVCPGAVIIFLVLGLTMLGDGLRDLLDPRIKR